VSVPTAPTVLDDRALNRALMHRQFLSERHALPVLEAIEHLVGMQSQIPLSPYVGLWSRLTGFVQHQLADLIESRQVVRVALMRSTLHLASARDCLELRPIVQPVLDREFFMVSPYGKNLAGVDLGELVAAGRAILEERALTNAELGRALQERWPGRDATSLGYAMRNNVALVQVPPRGVWGKRGRPACTTAEHWLGKPVSDDTRPDAMLLRYLAAFGPATVRDMEAWSRLADLAPVVERLRPRLRVFEGSRGQTLFDVPDGPLPDPQLPIPPRFLPEYDNVLVAFADRRRLLPDAWRSRVTTNLGRPVLLVDGFAHGHWTIETRPDRATLSVELFGPLAGTATAQVRREGQALLDWFAPTARTRQVQIDVVG
jgi:hypothetical protein